MKNHILIVGGYGAVGSIIATNLSRSYPHQVIVAGRDRSKAQQLSNKLNHRVIPKYFDLDLCLYDDILSGVSTVIVCIDSTHSKFVEACIIKGITYIDISAQHEMHQKIEQFDEQARANKSTIILSVGLAPGLTNILAYHAYRQLNNPQNIDIFVLLGLGERHGEQAYRWTFNNIDSSYTVNNELIKSFSFPKKTYLLGTRSFYTFNFSDQHALSQTLISSKVKTHIAFDRAWFTSLTALLRKTGMTKVFQHKKIQNLLMKFFQLFPLGSDVFAVKASAIDANDNTVSYSFKGNNEGKITAAFTTEMIIYLRDKERLPYGVFHSHDIIEDVLPFISKIETYDSSFQFRRD